MELKPLEEIAFINPDLIKKDYPYDEIEYLDIQSVGSGYLIESKLMPLSEAPSRAKRLIKDGDTILSTVRPNRRSFLYIKEPNSNVVVSTGFAVLRAKEGIDSRYLYYAIIDQKFTDYLTLSAKGGAYPAVDTEIIQKGKIPVFAIDVQQKISSILSTYDDLIEKNIRRIQNLGEGNWQNPDYLSVGKGSKYKQSRGGYEFSGLVKKAKEMRKAQTPPEKLLWELLRDRQFGGLKFRRQHQIGNYIVDFYCYEKRFVIELDGGIHQNMKQIKKDKKRDEYLKALAINVIRFKNKDVINDIEQVLFSITNLPLGEGIGLRVILAQKVINLPVAR